MKNPVIRILVIITLILFFHFQMTATVTTAISSENWTTGVKEGDLITMNTIVQVTPFEYQIMSGGSLFQTTDVQDDKTEFLITDITSDTIWFVRKTFDSAGSLKVESDPIPIPKTNTDIRVNFFYPNTYDDTNGFFFTPVITNNTDELISAYIDHVEYVLILTTDKITFEYTGSLEVFSNHRLEYDRDTGIFRYLEWRFKTGVLASQAIREDLLDEYVHSKCVVCDLETSTRDIAIGDFEGENLVDRLILIGGILAVSIGGYFVLPRLNILWGKSKISSQVKDLLDSILGVKSAAFILLTIRLDQSTDQQAEYTQDIPSQILEFKFLMNPVRLSICKVLKENVEIASRELRDTLGLSWGDFSTHTAALKKRDFIHSYSKFEDGMEKQYMSLEPEGEKRFTELVDLLLNFLNDEQSIITK
ncbi:MAG: hypothetical protein GPJ54_12640 [Candidatus Heimdallarchaeota archaeon]|nr:hypothetical protein [Candidatus Heimdallarchaeota archaeon]